MGTREIPREDWSRFLDGFSRRHEGWLASLQVLSDLGAQLEAEGLPLEGVSVASAKGDAISVSLGDSPEDRVEHVVESARRVFVQEAGSAELALEIESGAGEKTVLMFRSASPAESVDTVRSAGPGKGREK